MLNCIITFRTSFDSCTPVRYMSISVTITSRPSNTRSIRSISLSERYADNTKTYGFVFLQFYCLFSVRQSMIYSTSSS